MPSTRLAFVTTLVVAAAAPSLAEHRIIIRHDKPDSAYLALGARHPAVGRVGGRMGDGTLVGDRWVLTAGHVANGLMSRAQSPEVAFGDQRVRVRRAFIHPQWVEMAPQDIALLELESPIRGIAPVGLHADRDEAGRVAVLVGHGRTGTGADRQRRDDDMKRGATNKVEEVTPDQIIFRFDAPPGGTDLEGIPGAGDSGGPALLEHNGTWTVAGVSSAGRPGRNGPGTYDAWDHFTRVSSFVPWLRDVMAGRVSPTEFPRRP